MEYGKAIARTTGNAIEATAFNFGIFNEFVSFLDRGERTTRTYLANLRQFAAWLKYTAVAQPTRQDILSYRNWLSSEHDAIEFAPETTMGWRYRSGHSSSLACKPATVRLYMQSVKQLFKWTAASGLYPDIAAQVHCPKVRGDIHKKDAFTPAEVFTIEKSIETKAAERNAAQALFAKDTAGRLQRSTEQGKRLYAMYLLAVNAGLRTIEISRANIKDLETKGGQTWLYIWGKGHSEADQKKPIAPEVYEAIKDYLSSRTDNPVANSPLFVSTGNRSHGKRIATTTISTMLKSAMVQAGFDSERLTAHSLRHTAGTTVMELTNNLYTTQKYMRHSNPTTTEVYLHNETEKQEAGIAKQLYALYHGQADSNRARLEDLLDKMNGEQLEKLTQLAASL